MKEKERLSRVNIEYYSLEYHETQIRCRADQEINALRYRRDPAQETVTQITSHLCASSLELYAKMAKDSQQRAERFRACVEYATRRASGMAEIEAYNSTTWRR